MIYPAVTPVPPAVTDLLEEIRVDASLNQKQRNELVALLERGDIEQAEDLLHAWRITA
jgi:hypothetical protein